MDFDFSRQRHSDIENVFSQKYLDVGGRSTSNGGGIVQFDYNGQTDQQWRLLPLSEGSQFHYVIQNVYNDKVLTVDGNSTDDGANIVQYDYNGSASQVWGFE